MSVDSALTRLYHPDQRPFEQLGFAGMAIYCRPKVGPEDEVRHVGVLYRRGMSILLLDLPGDGRLLNEPPPQKYSWLEPPIPLVKGRVLAQQCLRIARHYRNKKLPLGLRYIGARFADGTLVTEGECGLTCATFVLAVFLTIGVRLLRTEEWVLRIDDIPAQHLLVSKYRRSGDVASFHAVQEELSQGAPRVRPEEVAAAGTARTVDILPLSFQDARCIGERIADELLTRAMQRAAGNA